MGDVYLAADTKLGRRVAIKFLSASLVGDERANKRLIKEAQAAAILDHPNICAIHEINEDQGRNFIVMQYLEGKTLHERMKEQPPDLAESLAIASQVAEALATAHSHNIIHRDIKPANIMITTRGVAKVMDFGLAKAINPGEDITATAETHTLLSNPGTVVGTLPYMSPEQVRGEPLDARSDIFSFGVVLYELLSGQHPFTQKSAAATVAAILTHSPPPLMQLKSHALQQIISRCLEKDPDSRYRSMHDVVRDLASVTQELPRTRSTLADHVQTAILSSKSVTKTETTARRHWLILVLIALASVMVAAAGYFLHVRSGSNTSPVVKSLAILPLKPFDQNDSSLGLGIADAVIRKVSQTGQVVVRPTSAVRRYLNEDTDGLTAAHQLNVDAVLEGTVQRFNDSVRVSINLIRTSDGVSLWSNSIDMRQSNLFLIQDTVAQQVATQLRLKLDQGQQSRLTKPTTSSAGAYEAYLKGVFNLDQRGFGPSAVPQMMTTIQLFKDAIAADPNYALAHAQLAYAYAWMALFVNPEQSSWADLAKEEIERAQKLDPQLAETHLAQYLILWSGYGGWQMEPAIRELKWANQLNPNIGHIELGTLYQHAGLEDLATHELESALANDPNSEIIKRAIVGMHQIVRNYDEEFNADQKFFGAKEPDIWYLLAKGRLDEAQKRIDKLIQIGDDRYLANKKAILYALKGDFRAAEQQIPDILAEFPSRDPEHHHSTYDVACIYALEGKSQESVKWLTETASTGFPSYPLFERDQFLNRIRQQPEFIQFMSQMKVLNERLRNTAQQ